MIPSNEHQQCSFFYEELTKIIFQVSSNTHLICSSVKNHNFSNTQNCRYQSKLKQGYSTVRAICILLLFIYIYVNGSGLITSVGEERANLSAVVYL